MIHHEDDWLTVYLGDCREVLASLPAESVHCVVTSPPYWGLRDYGTASWDGGDEACDHASGRFERGGLSSKQASNHGSGGDEALPARGKRAPTSAATTTATAHSAPVGAARRTEVPIRCHPFSVPDPGPRHRRDRAPRGVRTRPGTGRGPRTGAARR